MTFLKFPTRQHALDGLLWTTDGYVPVSGGTGFNIRTNDQADTNSTYVQVIHPSYGADGATVTLVNTSSGIPVQFHYPTTQQLTWASVSASSSGVNSIISSSSGKTIRVFYLLAVAAAPVTVQLQDTTVTTFTGAIQCGFAGGFELPFCGEPFAVSGSGKGMSLNLGSAVQVSGLVAYMQS